MRTFKAILLFLTLGIASVAVADAPGYPPYSPRDDSFGRGAPGYSRERNADAPSPTHREKERKPERSPYEKLAVEELVRYQFCGQDRDCVKAQNGCCDCANGGEDVAVNRDRLQDFKDQFECEQAVCTERAAVPACGSGVVTCVNHRCKYVSQEDFR